MFYGNINIYSMFFFILWHACRKTLVTSFEFNYASRTQTLLCADLSLYSRHALVLQKVDTFLSTSTHLFYFPLLQSMKVT